MAKTEIAVLQDLNCMHFLNCIHLAFKEHEESPLNSPPASLLLECIRFWFKKDIAFAVGNFYKIFYDIFQ